MVSTMRFTSKTTPTNNTDYNCHIHLWKLFNQLCGIHITSPAINSLGDGHTHLTSWTKAILYEMPDGALAIVHQVVKTITLGFM